MSGERAVRALRVSPAAAAAQPPRTRPVLAAPPRHPDSLEDRRPMPLMLAAEQVGELLSLSERSVWRLVAVGVLPKPVRFNRAVRWKRAWVEDLASQLKADQSIRLPTDAEIAGQDRQETE